MSESVSSATSPVRPALAPAILLCDDDRIVLVTLGAALREAGYQVIEADNGDDAILLARQHRPDLAVLDIRMDGKNGLDVAAYLRDYVGTPFVFLSACNDEGFVRQARQFGALEYLEKPLPFDQIAPIIEAALQKARRLPIAEAPTARTAARAPAAAPGAVRAPAELPVVPTTLEVRPPSEDVWMATGILMERFGLPREQARARLRAWARQRGTDEEAAAAEVLDAVERLSSFSGADKPSVK